MTTSTIETMKYSHNGDVYYVIDGELFLCDDFGMHKIGTPSWNDRQYTYEEFILLDPSGAISAIKEGSELDRTHNHEELLVLDLAVKLLSYALENGWSVERVEAAVDKLGIDTDTMCEAVKIMYKIYGIEL